MPGGGFGLSCTRHGGRDKALLSPSLAAGSRGQCRGDASVPRSLCPAASTGLDRKGGRTVPSCRGSRCKGQGRMLAVAAASPVWHILHREPVPTVCHRSWLPTEPRGQADSFLAGKGNVCHPAWAADQLSLSLPARSCSEAEVAQHQSHCSLPPLLQGRLPQVGIPKFQQQEQGAAGPLRHGSAPHPGSRLPCCGCEYPAPSTRC